MSRILLVLRTLWVSVAFCALFFGVPTHAAPANEPGSSGTDIHAASGTSAVPATTPVPAPGDTTVEDADLEGVEPEPLAQEPAISKPSHKVDPGSTTSSGSATKFNVKPLNSVPYPNGAIYTPRGITGSFLGGKHRNLGEPQSLFQWQGELGYFYKPWFSGGVGFKITAGEPSDSAQKIRNRYFILTRFHWAGKQISAYIGPQLGTDNMNILNGVPKKDSLGKLITGTINNTNASLGLDMGAGWKFSRWVGLTYGAILEYSLVSEEGANWANSLNIHLFPGISVDLLSFSETLKSLVPAMYATAEFQGGFLLFEKNRNRHDQAFVTGLSVAF